MSIILAFWNDVYGASLRMLHCNNLSIKVLHLIPFLALEENMLYF